MKKTYKKSFVILTSLAVVALTIGFGVGVARSEEWNDNKVADSCGAPESPSANKPDTAAAPTTTAPATTAGSAAGGTATPPPPQK